MAGWARSGRSVHTAQLAVRSSSAKSYLICGRCDSPSRECLVPSTVHNLSARPWLVPQIRAANDFRLADKQAAAASRCWSWPSLQDWPTIRQLLRRAGLERIRRRAGSEVRNHLWIIAAVSEFLGFAEAIANELSTRKPL